MTAAGLHAFQRPQRPRLVWGAIATQAAELGHGSTHVLAEAKMDYLVEALERACDHLEQKGAYSRIFTLSARSLTRAE